MRKKRKAPAKVRPPKATSQPILDVPPLHIGFPFTLFHKSEKKFCYFSCEEHMKKYIERCKLTAKDFKVSRTLPKKDD